MLYSIREYFDLIRALNDFVTSTHMRPHQLVYFPSDTTDAAAQKLALEKAISKNPRLLHIEVDFSVLSSETELLASLGSKVCVSPKDAKQVLYVIIFNNFDPISDDLNQSPIDDLQHVLGQRKILVVYFYQVIPPQEVEEYISDLGNHLVKVIDDEDPKASSWSICTNQIPFVEADGSTSPAMQGMINLLNESRNITLTLANPKTDLELISILQGIDYDCILIINNYHWTSYLILEELWKRRSVELKRRESNLEMGESTLRFVVCRPVGKIYLIYHV
jgi:hypothetical protein